MKGVAAAGFGTASWAGDVEGVGGMVAEGGGGGEEAMGRYQGAGD